MKDILCHSTKDIYVSEEAPSTDNISQTFNIRPPPCGNKKQEVR